MRTITRTYDLFQLAELSAAARDTAYNEWLRTFEYGWDSDNRNTLEAFESVFKVKVNDWSYDTCRYSYRFTSRYSGEEEELSGIRLMKHIVNNYWHTLFKPKTYYLKGNFNKQRKSRIFTDNCCVLTGYCADEDILRPIYDFLKAPEPLCTTSWTSALTASSSRAVTIWNTSAAKRVLRRVAQPTTTSFWKTEKCITDKNDSDMKGTEHFKRTIQMYLEQRAAEDTLFAKNYRNPAKNIDDCVTYILNYVQRSGCNGFTDGEIFGQAVHYYDENEIEVGKPIQCQVAVNHVVELTAEEKAEARQNALRRYQEEELRKLQNRSKPRTATKATAQEVQQPNLFNF